MVTAPARLVQPIFRPPPQPAGSAADDSFEAAPALVPGSRGRLAERASREATRGAA